MLAALTLVGSSCGSPEKNGAPSASAAASAAAKPAREWKLTDVTARCSSEAAGAISGNATFVRRPDGKSDVVLRLSPPGEPMADAAIARPQVFGAARGDPTAKADGMSLELRTEVTFSQNPYVTFVVPIHCGSEAGQISAAVRWESEGTEPGKPLTVDVTPYE